MHSGLPSYDEAVHNEQRNTQGKRKIIPVEEADPSSSPATPSSPTSPNPSRFPGGRVRHSQSSFNLAKESNQVGEIYDRSIT